MRHRLGAFDQEAGRGVRCSRVARAGSGLRGRGEVGGGRGATDGLHLVGKLEYEERHYWRDVFSYKDEP